MITLEYATYIVEFNNKIPSDFTNLSDGVYKFALVVNNTPINVLLNCVNIITFNDLACLLDYRMRQYGLKVWVTDTGLCFSGLKPKIQVIKVVEYLVGDADWLWANVSGYMPVGR